MRSSALGAAALGLVLGAARTAHAEVRVSVRPVFGDGCLARNAPGELVATVDNPLATALHATLVLEHPNAPPNRVRTLQGVSVSVGARARVDVHLASADVVPGNDLVATLRDARGVEIAHSDVTSSRFAERMLVDATQGSRLALALRGAAGPEGVGDGLAPNGQPTACAVAREGASGDPIMPWSAQGYAGVLAVLIDTSTLTSMGARERVSLADYVLGGGTLAVVVDHAEDLQHPVMTALVGREVTTAPLTHPTGDAPAAQLYRGPVTAYVNTLPAADTLTHAIAFSGGNLHHRTLPAIFPPGSPDALGASAEYGHGQVHLLSFNPTRAPGLDDAWSATIVQHIATQAADLRERRLLTEVRDSAPVPAPVRALLSRPDTARAGIRHALALLGLYAVALPLALLALRALTRRRQGLLAVPAVALAASLTMGQVGARDRAALAHARTLTMMDLAAGFSRGAVRRFHAYTPSSSGPLALFLPGSDRTVAVDPDAGRGLVRALRDPSGTALQGINVLAWSPILVREEGFDTLAGNVSIVTDNTLGLRVINRLRDPLEDVIVLDTDGTAAWYFRWIPAGSARRAVWGTALPEATAQALHRGETFDGMPLWNSDRARQLAAQFNNPLSTTPTAAPTSATAVYSDLHLSPERMESWRAALAVAGMTPQRAWQAASEPVLIAHVVRRGTSGDNGFSLVREDTWIRVRGFGGAP